MRRTASSLALLLVVWLGGSGCVTAVPSGNLAVVLEASGRVRVLDEGLHGVSPLAHVEVHDLRLQERDQDLAAITRDGGRLQARASLVTYHVVREELLDYVRHVGTRHGEALLRAVVGSTVRQVLAGYRAAELTTAGIRKAQREIIRLAALRLRPYHLVVDGLEMRRLVVVSQPLSQVIVQTGVLEQEIQAMPQRLQLARQAADQRRQQAHGIADANRELRRSLGGPTLVHAATRAWEGLLSAPATRVVVVPSEQGHAVEVEP
jgi:hypothetical protein